MVRAFEDIVGVSEKKPRSFDEIVFGAELDRNQEIRNELDSIFINNGDLEELMDDKMKNALRLSPDSDDIKAKIANSFYISDAYEIDPAFAYENHDVFTERLWGKGTNAQTALSKIIEAKKLGQDVVRRRLTEKTLWQATKDFYHQSGLRMVKTLVGYARIEAEFGGAAREKMWNFLGADKPQYLQTIDENLLKWSEQMSEGVEEYYRTHPEEFIQARGSGFLDTTRAYLSNPIAVYQGVLEAVPLMLEAYLGHIITGGVATALGAAPRTVQATQWIGRVQGMAVPMLGENYAQSRDRGQNPMTALPQAFLTAEIDSLIEEWVIRQRVKIFQGQGALARRGIVTAVARGLYGAGKSYVRGVAEQFTQAISRNFWDIVFTDSGTKLMDGVNQEAAAGGLIELAMSGAFAVAGRLRRLGASRQVSNDIKLQRIEAVRDMFNKSDMSPEYKAELNEECNRVKAEVESAAEAGKAVPTEPTGVGPKIRLVKSERESIAEDKLVEIDTSILENAWKLDKSYYFGKGEEDILGRRPEIEQRIAAGEELNAPIVTLEQSPEGIEAHFTDGRHTFAVLRDMGVKKVKVVLDTESQKLLKEITSPAEIEPTGEAGVEVPAEVTAEKAAETEPAPAPQNLQEEIDRTPRFGLGPDGKTVVDYETQKEVRTYRTNYEAVLRMNNFNSGKEVIAEERPAPLLPSEDKTYTIRQLLNFVMKGMEKSSRRAYLDGARMIIKQHRDLGRYANEQLKGLNLTKSQREQLVNAVARTRTSAEKVSAIAIINALVEKSTHKQAVTDLKKTVRFINKRIGNIMQESGIRPEYLEKIRDITETFTFTKPTEKTKQRLESLKGYIDSLRETEMNKYERDFAEELLPKNLVEKLEKLNLKSVRDMSSDEVKDLNIALRMLVHLNDTKNRIILERTARNAAEIINGAMDELDNVVNKSVIPKERTLRTDFQNDTVIGKFIRWIATTNNHDLETLVDTITGGQKGFAFEAIVEAFSDGRTQRDLFSGRVTDEVIKTFKDNNISLRDLQMQSDAFERMFKTESTKPIRDFMSEIFGIVSTPKQEVSLGGIKIFLTKDELMSLYMHSNASYNLNALFNEGVASWKTALGKVTPGEIARIAELVESDPKAKACCDMAARLYKDVYAPAINAISLVLKGIELANEKDFWHIERYTGGGIAGAETFRLGLLESIGWIQPRTGSKNPITIRGFWEVFFNSRQAIAEYVGMSKAYRAAKMLFNYKPYREKIRSLGYAKELQAIDEIIRNTEQHPFDRAPIDDVVARIMRGTVRVGLSFPGTWLGQWTSVLSYFTETSKKYLTPKNIAPASKAEIERYRANWPFFRQRMDGGVSSIALQDVSQTDELLRAFTHKTDWVNYVTQGIHSVDIRTIAAGGRLIETEMTDKNLDGRSKEYWDRRGIKPSELEFESEEYWFEFNKRARYLSRRTQPMFEGENRSLHTGVREPSKRMWFLFRSYVDQVLRMAYREYTARENNRISRSEMVGNWGLLWAGLASFSIIQWLTAKILYRDERDWKDLGIDIALAPLKLLTIIGYPLQLIFKKIVAIQLDKKLTMSEPRADTIVTQFINEMLKGVTDLAVGIGYLGKDERYISGKHKRESKAKVKILTGLIQITATLAEYFGIPASRIQRIYEGWTKEPERLPTTD